jgi:gp107
MLRLALTTEDNPYDPFDEFEEWFNFDVTQGYHTCAYLARVATTSTDLTEADQVEATNEAIEEILELNLTGNYQVVEREF